MKNKIKKLIVLPLFLFLFMASASACLAIKPEIVQEMTNQADSFAGSSSLKTDSNLAEVVSVALKLILGTLGLVFLILTVTAGFKWMTAGGNEDTIKKAQGNIKNSLFGLVIVIAAYGITYFIFNVLPLGFSNDGGGSGSAASNNWVVKPYANF